MVKPPRRSHKRSVPDNGMSGVMNEGRAAADCWKERGDEAESVTFDGPSGALEQVSFAADRRVWVGGRFQDSSSFRPAVFATKEDRRKRQGQSTRALISVLLSPHGHLQQ